MSDEEKYERLLADFINFRNRTEREKQELKKTACEDLILALLPVLDNIERIPCPDIGVRLIYRDFIRILKGYGLEEIDALGKEFTTDEHEAVGGSGHTVSKVVQKGYRLGGKVIRHAKVIVE